MNQLSSQVHYQRGLEEGKKAAYSGDFNKASSIFRAMLRKYPGDGYLSYLLGSCLMAYGDLRPAEKYLKKALKIKPDGVEVLCDFARLRMRQERYTDAMRQADKALRLAPDDYRAITTRGELLSLTGKYEEAYEFLKQHAASQPGALPLAAAFARACQRLKRYDEGIAALETCFEVNQSTPQERTHSMFLFGKLYEDAGRYDEAFRVFEEANRTRFAEYDPESFEGTVERVVRRWSAEVIAQRPQGKRKSGHLVFILGMPRSGTSLVEQILASHSQVHGAGELTHLDQIVKEWIGNFSASGIWMLDDFDLLTEEAVRTAQARYLDEIRKLAPGAARVTDKLPLNFLHLGVIDRLFPQARVIHCRRNPMDTCLSIYTQDFAGAHPYAYDQRHLGHFYRQYERLMNHWKEVLSIPIRDVVYEELVSDQERVSREMIEFLDLPWEDACLRFHETTRVVATLSNDQVRRPMYKTAVNRHERFGKFLGPLREALGG